MNWKLLFQLSLFGLIMAVTTVSMVPSQVEPLFWLVIFIVCAYYIAKNAPGKYFLHGFVLSLINSIWITTFHVLFFRQYIENHPEMLIMNSKLPMAEHPRILMIFMGPLFGAGFGLVQGFFAFVASKVLKKKTSA